MTKRTKKTEIAEIETKTPAPSLHEELTALAYSLWEQRGRPHGSPDEDWFAAEQQLTLRTADLVADLPRPADRSLAAAAGSEQSITGRRRAARS